MAVEERQIHFGSGDEAGLTHAQGIRGQRRSDPHQLGGRPGCREASGRGFITDGNSQRRGVEGSQFAGSGQKLARCGTDPFDAEEDFVPVSIESGERIGAEANIAKLLASEASWQAAEACVQTLGGFAFAEEYDVERKYREARLYQVAPVSTNLILAYIAEHVLELPRSY